MSAARRRIGLIIVLAGVAIYTGLMTYLTWVRYEVLRAPTFDMGVNLQIMSSILSTGLPLETPNWAISKGAVSTNYFGVHFSPVRYLLAGAYWIYPSAETLLFLQALFVALGAVPLYKLSQHLLQDERTSVLVSLAYLFFPPLIMSNLFDFHEEALIPFLLVSAYYLYVTRQYTKALVLFIVTFMVQEAATALIFAVALQLLLLNWEDFRLLLTQHRWTRGTALAVALLLASPAAFLLENLLFVTLNPIAGFVPTAPTAYALSLSNFFLYLPQKTAYWIIILGLTMFLPLLSRRTLVTMVPWFVVSVFSRNSVFSQLYWQYIFLVVFALFIGVIYGLRILQQMQNISQPITRRFFFSRLLYKNLPIALLVTALLFNPFYPLLVGYLPVNPQLVYNYSPPSNRMQAEQFFQLVPSGASVLASDYVFPHLAPSINVYPIIYGYNNSAGSFYIATNMLPNNFTPKYVVIFPSDYVVSSRLVPTFPSAYCKLAEINIDYRNFSGFNAFENQNVTVLLYQYGCTGP